MPIPDQTVDPEMLRVTMRKWASGVTVVTTALESESGVQRAGMTVSSFTSVNLDPPTILVCLDDSTYTYSLVKKSGVFAVSILAVGQDNLSTRFAGLDPKISDRFAGLELTTALTGAPILPGIAAWLDCRVSALYDAGSHTIVLGEVLAAGNETAAMPLIYFNRGYHALPAVQNA
ncbi:MAG: flavin reductase family protein [Anaerolineae bacterium]|nr:flavin reductase family protein [Anaerolineae bacterium]